MKNWKLVISSFAVAMMLFAVPAHAWFIDLDVGPPNPTDAYIAFAGPTQVGSPGLVGSNINVISIIGVGTPQNAGTIVPLEGARLDFNTGNLWSWSTAGWTFAGGEKSSITVTYDGNTLLTGYFQAAAVDVLYSRTSEGFFTIANAAFLDLKNPELLAYFGLSAYDGQYMQGNLNISFYLDGIAPDPFYVPYNKIGSGDVLNTPVPEPGMMLLFGLGLVGVAGVSKFKK